MKNRYYKRLLAILMLVLQTALLNAQEVDINYATRMNYIFQHLDKAKVPYGLLKDQALELAELKYYGGSLLLDSNRVFFENFMDIYRTIYTSKIHISAAANLPNPGMVDSVWFSKRKPLQVTLAGLYYKYSRFADNASSKVTILNNQIYDKYINGIWQNPYKTEEVIGFAPADMEYTGLAFSFKLPAELWLSNQKNLVSKIELNADDGLGYRTLLPDVPLPVVYADSGVKYLKFKIWLTNNTVLQSHTVLHIAKSKYLYIPTEIQQPNQGFKANVNSFMPANCISGNADVDGIEKLMMVSSESFNGKFARGLITIKYANADHKIHKPLIVAEGFDYGIYSMPEDIRGENTFEYFGDNIGHSDDLNNLLINIPQYDLIYIDWQNGTEDLRLNALLLKTVIECVNTVKVANGMGDKEKNVVLGISMGGVIARYTLKKMENAGEDHDTRLYISLDGPQQGANVPLGFQAAILHLHDMFVKPAGDNPENFPLSVGSNVKLSYLANTPASKQMLVNRLKPDGTLDDAEHISWQSELTTLGYPQQCRNIAISNGSECGNPFPINAGEHLVYLDGYYKTKLLTELLMALTADFTAPILGLATKSWKVFFYALIPGSNKFSFHVEANALAANGFSNLIYKNKVQYMKKVLWLIPVTETLASKTVNAPLGLKTVESFPGGHIKLYEQDEKFTSNADNAFYKGSYQLTIKKGFSFIPTASTLDIGSGQLVLSQADYYQPYIGAFPPSAPKNSPYANFITAFNDGTDQNEEHTSFTQRNGSWLTGELSIVNPLPQADCSQLCALQLDGTVDCLKSGIVFQVLNVPVGASINWSISGPATIVGPNNTSNITINSLGTGTAKLEVTVTTTTCSRTLSKTISNIPPVFPFIDYSVILPNPGMWTCQFWVTNYEPGYVYNWYINGILTLSSPSNFFQYNFGCGYLPFTTVKCVRTNECTSSPTSNILYLFPPPCNYIVFPNPASESVTIGYNQEKLQEFERLNQPSPEFEINLYNEKGLLMLNAKSREGQRELHLDTRNLPNGNYFLHIQQGKQVIKEQIIIQH